MTDANAGVSTVTAPATGLTHRRIMTIIVSLMLGMFLSALDQTIVSTALPTIAGDLHGLDHLSWVVTAYLITSTISLPLWGKFGDLWGRKGFYQLSVVIFLAGSALSGLSQNMAELIAFRAIQGLGAGGLMVGSQAIVGDVIPPRERGRYMGFFGAVFGLSSVLGPLAGGWLTQHASWRWIFYINLPIGIVALMVIAAGLHVPKHRVAHRIDWWGSAVLSAAVVGLILITTWGGTQYSWRSAPIVVLAILSATLLIVFIPIERRAREPIIPMGLFSNRTFSAASSVGFVIGFAMFGAIVYLPLYLQVVHGSSPTRSGLELLPMVVGMLITFILSGQLVSRTGRYKVFPIVGTAITALGLVLLSHLGTVTPYTTTAFDMFVTGFGMGLVMQVLVVAVQNAVPHGQLGTATATATFFRSIGGAFGVSILGSVFDSRLLSVLFAHTTLAQRRLLSAGSLSANPAQISRLPTPERTLVIHAFNAALERVFLVAAPIALVAFALTWLLKEIPLRTTAHVRTHTSEAGEVHVTALDAPGEFPA